MRDILIVFLMCMAAIAVGALLFFSAPRSLTGTPGTEGDGQAAPAALEPLFAVIDAGEHASVAERKNYAARDEAAYARLWEMAHGDDGAAMPPVDFSTHYVIGVFAGEKPTGGHGIAVTRIVDEGNVRTLHTEVRAPGEGCAASQAITSPYMLITVPQSAHELEAADAEAVADCL